MDDTHNFSNNAKHLKELGLRHDLTKVARETETRPVCTLKCPTGIQDCKKIFLEDYADKDMHMQEGCIKQRAPDAEVQFSFSHLANFVYLYTD